MPKFAPECVAGENDAVRRAVGRAPISGRGLRILTMDGGGMKGIATLRLIRQVDSGICTCILIANEHARAATPQAPT